MKRYRYLNIIPYQRLFEGKKQALQMLTKYFDRQQSKHILLVLEKLDPTSPKNKYIETFAKVFISSYKLTYGRNIQDDFINIILDNFKEMNKINKIKDKIESIEKRNLKIDLSKIKDIYDLGTHINTVYSKKTKSVARQGMKGLQKGKDYLEYKVNDRNMGVYIPYNEPTSRIIASKKVGHVEGEWCTAFQKTNEHWINYIHEKEGILVYIVNYDPEEGKTIYGKQAIFFYADKSSIEMFDAEDNNIGTLSYVSINEIKKFVTTNWNKIREGYEPEYKEFSKEAVKILDGKTKEAMEILDKQLGFKFKSKQFLTPTEYLVEGDKGKINILLTLQTEISSTQSRMSITIMHRDISQITTIDHYFFETYDKVEPWLKGKLQQFGYKLLQKRIKDGGYVKGNVDEELIKFTSMDYTRVYTQDMEKVIADFLVYFDDREQRGKDALLVMLKHQGIGEYFDDVSEMIRTFDYSFKEIQHVVGSETFNLVRMRNPIKPIAFGTWKGIKEFWKRLVRDAVKRSFGNYGNVRQFGIEDDEVIDKFLDYSKLEKDFNPESVDPESVDIRNLVSAFSDREKLADYIAERDDLVMELGKRKKVLTTSANKLDYFVLNPSPTYESLL